MAGKTETGISQIFEAGLVAYLNGFSQEKCPEAIDDLIHWLQFERRWRMLTHKERAHAEGLPLSPEARKRLNKAKTKKEFDELIEMYARADYFRRCAWVAYFNGDGEKPFTSSSDEKKVA